ncbi:nucleoside-diphosphate sugar epimerase/dehydratase [Cesiribacter sp. SM1]|uniref:polysaccharide biosynthesis protein n=1 Tax=Cesiribacter sp. SM1 TaxID=2861196 RepID=UPI001CD307F2|nr:nucleoside-diphosphate sugar epimerase/dehydratase [Cesiribacter sp. SM1]
MNNPVKSFLLNKALPRWIILSIDQLINCTAFAFAFFLLFRFEFSLILRGYFFIYVGVYMLLSLSVFYLMRVHTGLIRYSSLYDAYRIFTAVLTTNVVYAVVAYFWLTPEYPLVNVNILSVLLVSFFISSSLLIKLRIGIKSLFHYMKSQSSDAVQERVLIYGSDNLSVLAKQALETSGMGRLTIIGFIDDNSNKIHKEIQQKRVYHVSELEKLKYKCHIDKLVAYDEDLKSNAKKEIFEKCLELGIKVITIPLPEQWMSGQLSMNQMKNLKIEDLLQRSPIVIENEKISGDLAGKRILITGAAGSIGSEIVRQVLNYNPAMVVVCDQAETPLHELQLEMEEAFPDANLYVFIGDIQNFNRMYTMFDQFSPQIVYHAAAYKHVPMMEGNPTEAILTNVQGTKNLADLSMTFDVEKFVMISTDKAVNPTNVMGTSKRIAEIYVQSLQRMNAGNVNGRSNGKANHSAPQTKFITTRFGNVLGSNGSVIPRFRAQIEKGGPVTVTHPDITRYFMTIPEAVQLVLEAGTMGKGGEIFCFDMGEPVKIVDLARKMIKLSGFRPDVDIKIIFTGLRPGEKLYEELLNKEESTIPTYHKKIQVSKVREYSYHQVSKDINELLSLNSDGDDLKVVAKMKQIVPEFISKNSRFQRLDVYSKSKSQ